MRHGQREREGGIWRGITFQIVGRILCLLIQGHSCLSESFFFWRQLEERALDGIGVYCTGAYLCARNVQVDIRHT